MESLSATSGDTTLQHGLKSSAQLLSVLVSQAMSSQAIESVSEQLQIQDPVARILMQGVAPAALGLFIIGSAGDSAVRKGVGIGIAATGAKYALEQPVKEAVKLALEREANGDPVAAAIRSRARTDTPLRLVKAQ